MPGKEKLQSAEGRRLWGLRRSLFRLTGPGFLVYELADGTYQLNGPGDAAPADARRAFVTTLHQRSGR